MDRRHFLGVVGSLSTSPLFAAPLPRVKSDISLIYVENGITMVSKEFCTLWRLRVKEGEFGKPEVITTLHEKLLTGWGHSLIGNRYVALHGGGVIDLKERQLIHDELRGQYIGSDGNSVFYRLGWQQIKGPEEVWAFDLKERKSVKLDAPGRWALKGQISPDGQHSISKTESGIATYDQSGEAVFLGRDYRIPLNVEKVATIDFPTPAIWIDNDTILTQLDNGELVTVNIKTKRRTSFSTVEMTEFEQKCYPSLSRDINGRIIYRLGHSNHLIDLKNRKTTLMAELWVPLGHGFDYMEAENEIRGARLRHAENAVGTVYGIIRDAKTFAGHIAFESRRAEEIRLWSALSKQWMEQRIRLKSIIGWIEN